MADAQAPRTSGQEPTGGAGASGRQGPANPQVGNGAGADERSGTDGGQRSPSAEQPPTSDAAVATHDQQHPHDDMTPEQLRAALSKARAEAAENRRKAKELDDLRQAEADAKLSETEKLQKQLAETQAERDRITQQVQERVVRAEVRSTARELGIKPELALRLIDLAAIAFDDVGDPTNISELLAAAMKEFGLTPAQSAQPAPSSGPRTGPTNPPRGGQIAGANGTFAANEIPRLNDPRLWRR